MEYASEAKANTALGFGLAGTGIGVLNSVGGLAGLLGIGPRNNAPADPGDRPVTRYEMGLMQENNALKDENVLLKSQRYTDDKVNAVQTWTAGATATMGFMAQQIQQLYGITQLVVPNGSVSPGWGPSQVRPFPPFPPVTTPPTVSSGTSDTAAAG